MRDYVTKRSELQRTLGDRGEMLARVMRGNATYPAAGWYAIVNGQLFYFGDHTGVALAVMFNGVGYPIAPASLNGS